SMAKALGARCPLAASWARRKQSNVHTPGTQASTSGGSPVGCAGAVTMLDGIEREDLAENARRIGDALMAELQVLAKNYPKVLCAVRGFGLIIGLEFEPKLLAFAGEKRSPATQVVNRLHKAGVLNVPAAN